MFNATPDHLTLILSFTGKPESKFPDWLRPELADRIGARNVILLPPLSRDEARGFLAEFLGHFRSDGQSTDTFFPFTEKAVTYMLGRLLKADVNAFGLGGLVEKGGIRPRALLKYCGAALQEHVDKQLALPIDDVFVTSVIAK
jgi:hypothetical protein